MTPHLLAPITLALVVAITAALALHHLLGIATKAIGMVIL